MNLRELPPTAGLAPSLADLWSRPSGEFANLLADWLGIEEVQIECSGTASLYIALEYLKGKSKSREVVVLAFTCPLVALAVQKAGLELRLCDVAEHSFEFDLDRLVAAVGPNTLCVIVTHWGGALTDAAAVRDVLAQCAPQAVLIEDCAQAMGGTVDGHSVGLTGDIAIFSFAVGKGLTLYEGGCLLAKDPAVRAGLRHTGANLRQRSKGMEWWRCVELAAYHVAYRPQALRIAYGWPRRYWFWRKDPVRAYGDDQQDIPVHGVGSWRRRVGANALKRLHAHLAATRKRFSLLEHSITSEGLGRVAASPPGCLPPATYLMLMLDRSEQASEFIRRSAPLGLGVTRQFAFPLICYPALSAIVGAADTPRAMQLSARSVTLTTSAYATENEKARVLQLLRDIVLA